MELELIEDARQLHAFEPEWSAFVHRFPAATPFQMPEWLLTWWSHFGSGQLRVLVFRNGGEVTGVLPAFLHEWNGLRQITLVGSGITDYLDPLLDPQSVPAVVCAVRAQLHSWSDWDICDWQDLAADTPLSALGTPSEDAPCSAIDLTQPFDEFLANRPAEMRRNLRRLRARAEALGQVEFSVSEQPDPGLLDTLVSLHGSRWERSGQSGMIEANRSEAFLREVADHFGRRGMLRIFTLRFEHRIAAIILALCTPSTVFGYLSAFDPIHAKLGFGAELLSQALWDTHEHGFREWNFLRGDEPYKFVWGAQAIARCRVVIRR